MEWEREERNETSDPSCFAPRANDGRLAGAGEQAHDTEEVEMEVEQEGRVVEKRGREALVPDCYICRMSRLVLLLGAYF